MEIIRGKHASFIDSLAVDGRDAVHVDVGTGDGRFVWHIAQTQPRSFAIGIDACRENLHEVSRRAPSNALFVIANAQALPAELAGVATHITINFPWGSLLGGLVENDTGLMEGLREIARPNARIEIRLNGGALAEQGWPLEDGAARVRHVLAANGFEMRQASMLTARELKACPTTWAKRLAYGRDPRAWHLTGWLRLVL